MKGLPLIANQKSRRRIRKDAYCPCGANEKYEFCCLSRGIEYYRDEEGNIVRVVRMDDEMLEAANGLIASYEDIFYRKIVDDDPLFLEMLLYSDEERMEKSVEVLKYAFGMSEDELYAYKKTGILITRANKKSAPMHDIREFEEARKEYNDIESGRKKVEIDYTKELEYEIENWVVRLIYLFALILYKAEHSPETVSANPEVRLAPGYILFCLTKQTKTLKATRALTNSYFNEDALTLVRSMYENYLHVSSALHDPAHFEDELKAKAGLQNETHFWEKDYIKEKSSGKIVRILNNKQRAALDKEFQHENLMLYRGLYDYLSSFVHPSLKIASHYFEDNKLSHNSNRWQLPIFFYIVLVNVLLLFDLLRYRLFKGQSSLDIKKFIKLIIPVLIETLAATNSEDSPVISKRLTKMLRSPILK